MADKDKTIEYAVTSDPAGFKAGMDATEKAARDAAARIGETFKAVESQMKGVMDTFKFITGAIGALTAVVAGGGVFKSVINESAAWQGEAKKLSTQLGVTTERASVMMVAMRHLGIDSELVSSAAAKMSKQIFSNAQAFEKLGVQVKDSAGQYRPVTEVMAEVNAKLLEIKNPIEQNIAGQQVYGKGWSEIRATLKLTTEEMKAAEQKAKDLNLIVGEEGAAKAKQYKQSMNDMGLVMTSLEVQMGNAVMPTFVKLGAWMSGVAPAAGVIMGRVMESLVNILGMVSDVAMGLWNVALMVFKAIGDVIADVMGGKAPSAMEFFTNCLKVIEVAFLGLRVAIGLAIEIIMRNIEVFVANVMRMAAVAERALHLDFTGAKAAWARETANIEAIEQRHMARMVDIATQGKAKLDEIVMRAPKAAPDIKDKKIGAGPTYDFDKDKNKDKSRLSQWEEKLALDRDGFEREQQLAGTAQEFGKVRERDYWKNILDTVAMSTEERVQVNRKYLGLEHDLRKTAFDSEIAGEKAKLEEFRHNFNERLTIAATIYSQMVARYGADSKEAKEALGEINREQRKLAEQTAAREKVISEAKRNAALAEIDQEQKDAELQVSLGEMTQARLLQLEEGFEAKRYQIKLQALQEQQALLPGSDKDPVAMAELNAKMEELERQHQAKLRQIRGQAMVEDNRERQAMNSSMRSSFEGFIASTLQGTTTLQKGLQSLWAGILSAFTQFIAKKVVAWMLGETAQTTATVAGNAARTTSDWWAAAESVAANAWAAVKNIAMKAWEVAASVYSALASIPYVGPFIAPAAAVAATVAVLGFASHIASAEGGYDIPAGLNPVTQLHQREMVLPAKHADVIRSLADNGSGGAGATNLNVTITSMDSRGVKQVLMDNHAAVAAALKKSIRNFTV